MSYSIEALQRSARLVKAWGQTRLPDGRSLADALTIGSVSWWDVAAPNLAAFYLPPYLGSHHVTSLKQRARPYLGWLKHKASAWREPRRTAAGCAKWPEEPACLVLGFSPYIHRDVIQPVVDRLRRLGSPHPVSICDSMSLFGQLRLRSHEDRDQWHGLWEHWDRDVERQARAMHQAFRATIARLKAPGVLSSIVRDRDQPLWRQTRSLFEWLFRVYFPALLSHGAVASHMLRVHRPRVVISADVDDARNRVFCLTARQLAIPTVEIQFGMAASDAVEWEFFIADHLAVWGEQARQVMLSHGVPADRIAITGSPRFDESGRRAGTLSPAMSRLGIPRDKAVVLFASVHSGLVDARKLIAVKRAIFAAVPASGDVVLVVKPHPGEKPRETEQLAKPYRNILFADARDDIRDLIGECDAFVTLGSTATMDALLAGTPVIYPALSGLVWWDDQFLNSGATLVARSEPELAASLQAVADGSIGDRVRALESARQRFIEQWTFRADGRAAERIADLALDLAALASTGRGAAPLP